MPRFLPFDRLRACAPLGMTMRRLVGKTLPHQPDRCAVSPKRHTLVQASHCHSERIETITSPPMTIQRGISRLQRQDSSLDNCPVRYDFFDPLGMTRRRLVGKTLPHQPDRCAVSPKRHTLVQASHCHSERIETITSPPTTIQRGISRLQRQDSSLDNCPVRCDFFDPLGMTRRRLVGKTLPHQSDRCAVSPNVTLSSKRHTVIPSGSKTITPHRTTIQRGISRLQRQDSSLDNCPVRCDFFDPLGMTRRRLVGKTLPHQPDRCAVSPKRHILVQAPHCHSERIETITSPPTTIQRGISRLQRPDSSHSTGSGHAIRSPCHCAPATHSPAAHTPTATTASVPRRRSASPPT